MIYATTDTNGDGTITKNAHIAEFGTEAEARDYLLRGYDTLDFDPDKAEIFPGDYGDCWIKCHGEPAEYVVAPFTLDQVSVQRPGQHPGGGVWWVTPTEPVLVAVVPLRPDSTLLRDNG